MSTKKTKKIQILGTFPQSDWNQTDETKSDYIKNKPDIYSKEEIDAALGSYITDIDTLIGEGV